MFTLAASSLSAIHNGLRKSEKSRPQGFKQSSLETPRPRRPRQSSPNKRDPNWTPPEFKLKRGKKDITDTGPERQSRRSRFNDPKSNFGKRSQVYQMKYGNLKDELAKLEGQGRGHKTSFSRRSPTDRISADDFMKDFRASAGGAGSPATDRGHGKGRASPVRSGRFTEQESSRKSSVITKDFRTNAKNMDRPAGDRDRGRDGHGRDGRGRDGRGRDGRGRDDRDRNGPGRYDRGRDDRGRDDRGSDGRRRERPPPPDKRFSTTRSFVHARNAMKEQKERANASFPEAPSPKAPSLEARRDDRPSSGTRHEAVENKPEQLDGSPFRSQNKDERFPRREQASRSTDDGPIRIHHTTAASQFLYGRSVVEAALKDSRRQLYNLYIYSGDDRQNVSQDDLLIRLAQHRSVNIKRLSNDGLRTMDKMSGGRPHNGCVLEASPVPQLPLKALGPLSEDPQKPGFHVEIAHQSSEEENVNGTSDFVGYRLPQGRNPFVLLLDGILDPGNLGAILRTAVFLGVNGIAITKASSATLTPIALKASAGASEVATLFSVNSATEFLARSKENGWLVYAAVPATKRSKGNSHITVDRVETYDPLSSQPTVLVIGSEGEGLGKPVRRQANHDVSIPGSSGLLSSVVDSLNVSVATGILCSAFLKNQSSNMIEVSDEPVDSEAENGSRMW
ncbi:hypothetical protein ONZ43_g2919 [Nemania bipapillata]|uniref:Uncharacterized protein n=1 Tax=Nemania bipapillata TaxID=110536 RepID=A0ACC2IYZ4_9PEZI|nr:hypothetical protein ONZ43_g2919 [Nemania bipapillata]